MFRLPAKVLLPISCLLLVLSAGQGLAETRPLPAGEPCAVRKPVPASAAAEESPPDTAALREELRNSVVQIVTDSSIGTGFIFTRQGLALTALHVIEKAATISVHWQDGRTVRAQLSRRIPELDLAVLELPEGDYAPLTLGDSDRLAPGHPVIAIGFPPVDGLSARSSRVASRPSYRQTPLIEIASSLPPGYSGGPLLTSDGVVVGIIFSRCLPDKAELTLSIPTSDARSRIGPVPTLQ